MRRIGWSTDAIQSHKIAQSARASREAARRKMERGPRLADDGHTLVVPSAWYDEEAKEFWKARGFRWHAGTRTWRRDTRRPLDGKRYTAKAWLKATREKFYAFWPSLKPRPRTDCRECGEMFEPTHDGQRLCPDCEAARRIYRYTGDWR